MKCPHCGIEVEPGTIFCPECLTEIPWVPEYNTVETLLTKKKTKKEAEARAKERYMRDKRRKNRVLIKAAVLVLVLALMLGGKFAWDFWNHHSYDYQYQKAQSAYSHENFQEAMEFITRALELDEDNVTGNILCAQILQETGEGEAGIKRLEELLSLYPDNLELYDALIQLFLKAKEPERVRQLLSECSKEEIRERYAGYLPADPAASLDTGVYDEEQEIVLSAEDCRIYYTLDGKKPTTDSREYTEPIPIKEGVTEVHAFSVSPEGIPSDVVYWKYTVVIQGPEAPVVKPKAGTYEGPTKITMEIPDGCKGYYTFDGQVSTASEEYKGPVEMPGGVHTFHAILVAAGGKESEAVSREYTCIPAEGISQEGDGGLQKEEVPDEPGEGNASVVVGTPENG